MSREVHVRFWESMGLKCPALLTYLRAYDSVGQARASIGRYLDFYNRKRPHSSLDARTPDRAYFNHLPQVAAARISPPFLGRHSGRATPLGVPPQKWQPTTATGRGSTYPEPKPVQTKPATSICPCKGVRIRRWKERVHSKPTPKPFRGRCLGVPN